VHPNIAATKPTKVYDTFWRFAAERQNVFFRRLHNEPGPWTTDPILRDYKFTNAYRASDRVSQYLIRRVIYRDDLPDDPAEVFFRTLLFKTFNKIETWELLERRFGVIAYSEYSYRHYDTVLQAARASGRSIYSAAYIMPSASSFGHDRKHRNSLKLIEQMMADRLPLRLPEVRTMREAFTLLRAYPAIGDFLAYQYVTDINYSRLTNFGEDDFVVAGPGAIDGIRKCFTQSAGVSHADLIRMVADRQEDEFARRGLTFRTLWGRRLQLIDCQNLFCEVGKYARIAHPEFTGASGRTRIKQRFSPRSDAIDYWYPPKWGINESLPRRTVSDSSTADWFTMEGG
jgi:hypothetical protein